MSEQQTVTITKKQQLDTAGQAWVDYHISHLRKHMAALGMIEQPQEDIAPIIEANHLEDPIYSDGIDDTDSGEMVDDDPIPVKRGKKKPSAKRNAYNQPKVRRFIQRGQYMAEQQKTVERIKFNGHFYQIQRYPTGAVYVQDYPRARGPKVAECLSDFRKHFDVPVFRALTDDERAQYVHDAVAMINNCMATFVSDDDLVKITGESNWLQFAPFDYFCSCGYAWRDCGGDEPGELECRQCGKRQHIKMHRLPNGIKRSHVGPGAGQMSYCSDCCKWTLNKVNGTVVSCECGERKDTGYNCTHCFYDQHAIIKYGPARQNIGASLSFGGNPIDWTEHRLCLACGAEFDVEQSDY